MNAVAEWIFLAIGASAVPLWGILLVRAIRSRRRVRMAVVGFLASLGALASAVAWAQGVDLVFPNVVAADWLHYLAGVGRGALVMGALLLLLDHPVRSTDR